MGELNVSVVDLMGSYYELGLKQGEEIKTTQLIKQLDFLEELSVNSDPAKAEEVLKGISPKLLEELKGLANGLNLKLDTIIKLYSGYDVDFPSMGCTTFIQEDYYVRNYDFSPEIYDARLIFSNPLDGLQVLGLAKTSLEDLME